MIKRENELKFKVADESIIRSAHTTKRIVQWYLNPSVIKVELQRDTFLIHTPTQTIEWTPENQEDLMTAQHILKEQNPTIRFREMDSELFFTLKGKPAPGGPPEYETPIARSLYDTLSVFKEKEIAKVRYQVDVDGYNWDVDVFENKLKGLILAELEEKEGQVFPPKNIPSFLGEDVTHAIEYKNAHLGAHGLPGINPSLTQ